MTLSPSLLGLSRGIFDHGAGLVFALQPSRRKLFADGWGAAAHELDRAFESVVDLPEQPQAEPTWGSEHEDGPLLCRHGFFTSPVADQPSPRVDFCLAAPQDWQSQRVVLLLGAWGDDGFANRLRLARLLAAKGLASLIPETPFHGQRRAGDSRAGGSPIRRVLDHALLTRAAVLEGLAILSYLHAAGHHPSVAGFSMGASHAGAVAALSPRPVAAGLFAVGYSPTVPFLDGILHRSIAWPALGGRAAAEPRLRHLLGHISHLELPQPKAPHQVLIAGARSDAYIPAKAIEHLAKAWPDARIEWRQGGHVSMWLFELPWICRCLVELSS